MAEVKVSGIVEAMSERETIVSDLCHAVVVDESGGDDEDMKYLMTLKLHQHHHHHQHHQHHQHHHHRTTGLMWCTVALQDHVTKSV